MWWYNTGWWWWWVAFVIIFFLIPLGYGWGYLGQGPWYMRRRSGGTSRTNPPPGTEPPLDEEDYSGWGWGGVFLWAILIIAIIWLFAAWGSGGRAH